MFKFILLVATAWIVMSCAATHKQTNESPQGSARTPRDEVREYFEVATALAKVGSHLEASIYFEAALSSGGAEAKILPRLIGAQIRAGRLRAARKNLARFQEIAPTRACGDLAALLSRFAPGQASEGGETR
ncbi:MAG: hypothetical protein GY854_05320 [Deltaproteobacteria bacterium]|nr:hypothetical protein [Deltaproteobacteria bacterium]